jgi:hypothetical protein
MELLKKLQLNPTEPRTTRQFESERMRLSKLVIPLIRAKPVK